MEQGGWRLCAALMPLFHTHSNCRSAGACLYSTHTNVTWMQAYVPCVTYANAHAHTLAHAHTHAHTHTHTHARIHTQHSSPPPPPPCTKPHLRLHHLRGVPEQPPPLARGEQGAGPDQHAHLYSGEQRECRLSALLNRIVDSDQYFLRARG